MIMSSSIYHLHCPANSVVSFEVCLRMLFGFYQPPSAILQTALVATCVLLKDMFIFGFLSYFDVVELHLVTIIIGSSWCHEVKYLKRYQVIVLDTENRNLLTLSLPSVREFLYLLNIVGEYRRCAR